MSARWEDQALLEPISAADPCGLNLDDAPNVLIELDLDPLGLFGQTRSPEAPPLAQAWETGSEKAKAPPQWEKIEAAALQALAKSKDLRVLACLGTALLRTDGLPAFAQVLAIASHWLETYWGQVYPLVEEDAIARRNALNCLADPMAVVDRVARLPLVTSRKHGRFSLRDLDIAAGVLSPGPEDSRPDEAAIRAAFAEMPLEDLTALDEAGARASEALTSIGAKMRSEAGFENAPDFGLLTAQFAKLTRVCREQLALRSPGGGPAAVVETGSVGRAGFVGGAIRSRQDAILALDAVADFFRHNEPSSPIPLIVDRAKRLVAKDFLEVLADIAPDALAVARSAGGLRDQQS